MRHSIHAAPGKRALRRAFAALLLCTAADPVRAEDAPPPPLVLTDFRESPEKRFTPSSKQVTLSRQPGTDGLSVVIRPGDDGYPGVSLKPAQGAWNLARYAFVTALISNTGDKPLTIALRVDNAGDWKENPWNTESTEVQPGETKSLTTVFGLSYGRKPGFALKPEAVTGLMIFAAKSGAPQSFRIGSLQAGGKRGSVPPDPDRVVTVPENGILLGAEVELWSTQVAARDGAAAARTADRRRVTVAFSGKGPPLRFQPRSGRWDLRAANRVTIRLKNTGSTAAAPSAQVESSAGPTDRAASAGLIPPGCTGEIVVSFIPAVPWTGLRSVSESRSKSGSEAGPAAGTGTRFISDTVTAVLLFSDEKAGPQSWELESVTATAPPVALPEWLGKRPPEEGDWVQTFSEDFDGTAVDLRKWNIHAPNYWDQLSHFSRKNVVVGGGVARLRYERRTGRHNDTPDGKETPYATGFLDTYGKWVQRYGYFEARMKLPEAPGLWPAMWLMPDRGLAAGEQWERAGTGKGGMEFDILEFLSRWGPYRYNIAFHWDGYGDGHRQYGTTTVYTGADKDGYITAGLLWTPGRAVLYSNGTVVARWESPRISSVPSDLMFTHVSGGWDNSGLDDSRLPGEFVIDYVRCWQRKDLASPADGMKSAAAGEGAPVK